MFRPARMTKFVCTTAVIAACAYDVVVIQIWGDSASISQWFHSYREYPTCWLCLGFLLCHFIGILEGGPVHADPRTQPPKPVDYGPIK